MRVINLRIECSVSVDKTMLFTHSLKTECSLFTYEILNIFYGKRALNFKISLIYSLACTQILSFFVKTFIVVVLSPSSLNVVKDFASALQDFLRIARSRLLRVTLDFPKKASNFYELPFSVISD